MLQSIRIDARSVSILAFLAVSLFFSRPATVLSAQFTMNYGSHMGTSVTFVNVTEENDEFTPAAALFGPPIVSGNSMDFNPINFAAASTNGVGPPDMTDGQLLFRIEAKPGNAVQNIKFSEIGDSTLAGIGTDTTFTSVVMSGTINIHEVDGVGINVITFPFNMTFTPSNGNFFLATDGAGFQQWMGMAFVDVQQQLTNRGMFFSLGATEVSVNLNNLLTAFSETGTSSVISKKDLGLTVEVNIPEPGGMLLAGAGLLGMAGRWPRRGRKR